MNNVNEIIEDLKNKIDEISKAGQDATGDALNKINEIKQKTIIVLSQASTKISDITNNVSDADEIELSLQIVKNKSKDLYENAINRINELSKTKSQNVSKQDTKIVKKENNNHFVIEEAKSTFDPSKAINEVLEAKALDTLRNWLKPEDK